MSKLNFNYCLKSVIRLYIEKNQFFIQWAMLPEEKLIELIDFLNVKKCRFFMTYTLFSGGTKLYIGEHGLQTRPYWFNDPFPSNSRNTFLISLPERIYNEMRLLEKQSNIQLDYLVGLAFWSEYLTKPIRRGESFSFNSLYDFVLSDQEDYSALLAPKMNALNDKGVDIAECLSEIKKITQGYWESHYLSGVIPNVEKYGKKRLREFRQLSQDAQSDFYKVTAYDFLDNVICVDWLPINFDLNRLDDFFVKNIHYYQHAIYIRIYDSFFEHEILHHPHLVRLFAEEEQNTYGICIPNNPYYRLGRVNPQLMGRTKTSVFRQAIYNALVGNERHFNLSEQLAGLSYDELFHFEMAAERKIDMLGMRIGDLHGK